MRQVIEKSAVVIAAILGIVAYGAAIGIFGGALPAIADSIDPGVAGYYRRFLSSAIFLGLLPFAVVLAFRLRPATIGIAWPVKFSGCWWFAGFVFSGAAIGLAGSFDPALAAFYPFHPALVAGRSAPSFLLHASLYLLLYYLPWELAFRGVFIVLTTDTLVAEENRVGGTAFIVAMLQAAPSAIIHVGHPMSEVFGAVLFGIVFGYITLASRSILPALITHAASGITLDLMLVLRGPS